MILEIGGFKMTENTLQITLDSQLLSKEAINLPPKKRLELLLKSKKYPVAKKRTSSINQLKEMIALYDLCVLMLAKYLPTEKSKENFMLISLLDSQKDRSLVTEKAFKLLGNYEELENKITAIQEFFYQFQKSFPDLYESYNLDELTDASFNKMIENGRHLLNNISSVKTLLNRWGLDLDTAVIEG